MIEGTQDDLTIRGPPKKSALGFSLNKNVSTILDDRQYWHTSYLLQLTPSCHVSVVFFWDYLETFGRLCLSHGRRPTTSRVSWSLRYPEVPSRPGSSVQGASRCLEQLTADYVRFEQTNCTLQLNVLQDHQGN